MSVVCYFRPGTKKRILAGEYVKWVHGHKTRSSYLLAAVLSYPWWVDRKELDKLRAEAKEKSRLTGEPWVIDHIIPLTHPRVCGLSVPWNMRVIPARCNAHKGGSWEPDQLQLDL